MTTTSHYHSHVDDPVAAGSRLKEARLAAGLSQRQLAFPGCSAAYISRLEAGQRVASLQLLRKIAAKLSARRGVPRHRRRPRASAPVELVEADVALRLDDLDTARDLYERALQDECRAPREGGGTGRARPARASSRRSCSGGRLDRGGTRDGAFDGVRVARAHRDAGQGVCREGRARVGHRRLRARSGRCRCGRRLAREDPLRDLARKRAHRQR